MSAFAGFPHEAFTFFAELEQDNSKSFFTAHKATYDEHVRGALEELLEELASEFGGRVRMFRQYRDVRFSNDKSPYKTTTYGLLVDRPATEAALYAQLSSGGLFAGTGYHELARDQLERFRDAVAADATGPALETVVAGVEGAGLELSGQALKSAPRGFPKDHPRIRLLRHKGLVAGAQRQGVGGITREEALDHVGTCWRACAPLNAWLDAHVGASALTPEERFGRGR